MTGFGPTLLSAASAGTEVDAGRVRAPAENCGDRIAGGWMISEPPDCIGGRQGGVVMTRGRDNHGGQRPVERSRGKRRHACRLNRAVEGPVISLKVFIVRPVSCLVPVQERHHKARRLLVRPTRLVA
jgi:hypothetical protein